MARAFILPRDRPDDLQRRALELIGSEGLADRAMCFEPYLTDAVRGAEFRSSRGRADAARMAAIYQQTPAEVLLSLGDHLRHAPLREVGRFTPGCRLWGTRSRLHTLPIYSQFLALGGIEDQLRLLVYDAGEFVAHVGLYRGAGDPEFTEAETRRLDPHAEGVMAMLRCAARLRHSSMPEETGDALLRADGRVEMLSPTGRAWIRRAGVRDGLRTMVRRAERCDASLGSAMVADALVRWARLDGDSIRYLVHLQRPPRFTQPWDAALTPRQREVAGFLVQGATLSDVARVLEISYETVRTHARSVYKALGIRRRSDLLKLARARHG